MRIGVISDTHGLLRPQAVARLAGVEHILHAGDIGRPEVIAGLAGIAPVTAVRGNVDRGAWAEAYPEEVRLTLGGRTIHMLHDIKTLKPGDGGGADVVVAGHSHRPVVRADGGTLTLNPGSAGPRRFSLPVTLALLDLGPEGARAEIVALL